MELSYYYRKDVKVNLTVNIPGGGEPISAGCSECMRLMVHVTNKYILEELLI